VWCEREKSPTCLIKFLTQSFLLEIPDLFCIFAQI
jgi:hypothetical protein